MMDVDEVNHPPELPRNALRHLVAQRLMVKIIRGEIGPGTRLIATTLAFQLGVSATPVREALVELEQSGIIELTHHRGAQVGAFGRNELRDFYHVRCLLQCDAVRLVCGVIAEPRLDALQGEMRRLHGEPSADGRLFSDILVLDQRIRQVLIEHCRNKWLAYELGRYQSIEDALREIVGNGRIKHREALLPAVDLAAALRNNDPDAGARAMQRQVHVIAGTVETIVFDARP